MTTTYKCPKCGGSDYFMSQRNVVKGMGWAQRGSIKSIPVCRVCDEIMQGSQVGFKNWEDYGAGRSSGRTRWSSLSIRTQILFFLAALSFVVTLTGLINSALSQLTFSIGLIGGIISFMRDRK
jgi:hypothetical protein